MPTKIVTTGCCIAGGGPAGMMLGYLLARAGIEVMVLEKHADFLRDFRGDTIHPSTLEIMSELGLLDEFLKRPHQELRELVGLIGEDRVVLADFSHLPTRCHFIAFMPQWDFLDFLADEAKTYPNFRLEMQAEVTDLVEDRGTVTGVRAKVPDGTLDVRADLVVGADGRHSAVRDLAGLEVDDLGAPMDALWMRLSKKPEDGSVVLGRIQAGRLFVMLDRGDYWQCAFVIPKGGFADLRRRGLPAFRQAIVELNPALASRVQEIASWDDVKLLTVRVDRLKRWYKPGVLCIGDAAHAMSPVGGVGINLAVQDAVAAANILAGPLKKGPVPLEVLRKVQQRRMLPTRLMQAVQIFVQTRIISNVLAMQTQPRAPFAVKLLNAYPWLRRFPARLIGMGFRPEHVQRGNQKSETDGLTSDFRLPKPDQNIAGWTRSGGAWPSRKVLMLMMTFSPMSTRPSSVAEPICGSTTTLSLLSSFGFTAGSCSNTSRPGAAKLVILDHAGERVLVDHLAARRVDDIGRRLHQREPPRREQMIGRRRMRAVDGDDVHAGEHLVEAVPIGCLERLLDLRRHAPAIVIVDLQAEGARPLGDGLADAPHADDAEPLAVDAMAEHPGWRPAVPFAAAALQQIRALGEPARHGEDQRHGHVGGILGQHAWRVGDEDAAVPRGFEVDIVDAGAELGDQFELGSGLAQYAPVDAVGHRRHEHVCGLHRLDQLFA